MCEKVVIPGGVPVAAVVRRDQNYVVAVGEVSEWNLTLFITARSGRRQHNHRDRDVAPSAAARPYGFGVTSTLGGRGDGSGCIDRRTIENVTAPTAIIATPAAASTNGRGRRLGLRASAIV